MLLLLRRLRLFEAGVVGLFRSHFGSSAAISDQTRPLCRPRRQGRRPGGPSAAAQRLPCPLWLQGVWAGLTTTPCRPSPAAAAEETVFSHWPRPYRLRVIGQPTGCTASNTLFGRDGPCVDYRLQIVPGSPPMIAMSAHTQSEVSLGANLACSMNGSHWEGVQGSVGHWSNSGGGVKCNTPTGSERCRLQS